MFFSYVYCTLSDAEFNDFDRLTICWYLTAKMFEAVKTFNGNTIQGESCSSSSDAHNICFAGIDVEPHNILICIE